jgi:predicted amino acid-binding ACT domain protein
MWNIVGDSKVDLSQQIMESLLAMDMSVSLSSAPTGVDESLAAKGLLDIKMP